MRIYLKCFLILSLVLGVFSAGLAYAASGDILVIVTDELGSAATGATFNFACDGGTVDGVTDGGVDDSDGTGDGVITVSAAFAQGGPDCGEGESFATQNVEMNGYVTTVAGLTSYATSTENTAAVSLQFGYKVTVLTADNIPFHSATVEVGAGFSVDCVEDGSVGVYYCPTPTSNKNKNIKVERDFFISTTGQFPTSRSANTDSQVTATITDVRYKKIENIGVSIPGADRHTMSVSWTPTTDPNFGKYEIHRKETFGEVTHENSTLSLESFDREEASAIISAAGCNEPNYFVVYVIDADGNRSIISDEVQVTSGGCSGNPTPVVLEGTAVPEEVEETVEEAPEVPQAVQEQEVEEIAAVVEEVVEEAAPEPEPESSLLPPFPNPPPANPNPPARPETPAPRRGPVGQVINNVTSAYAAVVELVRERISQGFNLRETIRDNMALLFSIFR